MNSYFFNIIESVHVSECFYKIERVGVVEHLQGPRCAVTYSVYIPKEHLAIYRNSEVIQKSLGPKWGLKSETNEKYHYSSRICEGSDWAEAFSIAIGYCEEAMITISRIDFTGAKKC